MAGTVLNPDLYRLSVVSTTIECTAMDPNPYKHPAIILAKIRSAIEPSLQAAGFHFDGRNKPARPIYLYVDYFRKDQCFRLSWDRRDDKSFIGLIAEIIQEPDHLMTIAKVNFSGMAKSPRKRITAEVEMRITPFVDAINDYLSNSTSSGGSTLPI